ncbi:hypothetical protein L1N85_19705 [Paenibacillus alkaliterrae]|uniref:hypothetical protein n=1 Tax=Paenibacillus alkaliterrae TaxID=320909 RepID=UPI001F1BC5CD|nr:hypothetical protein [Paenibacillus alkaliterrae]MCF2940623.1 hypothetical protein [Paenibacillus alkaliterrae]
MENSASQGYRPVPPELRARDKELHNLQLRALDRYDFEEASKISIEQKALWDARYNKGQSSPSANGSVHVGEECLAS